MWALAPFPPSIVQVGRSSCCRRFSHTSARQPQGHMNTEDINRLSEAEPLMRRALAIDEASFGPDHPDVASSLNNLAQLLKATNRLSEAEPLMRRALAIDEASFG